MRQLAPAPALATMVSDFMVVDVVRETTRLRLPEPGLVLGIRYRGAAELVRPGDPGGSGSSRAHRKLSDATLAGMSNRARWMRTLAGSGVILARFRPGGAARFFAEPLHELFGQTVSLEDILPAREIATLQGQVAEAHDDPARVAVLQSFLLHRLRASRPDDLVTAALTAIARARGSVRIRDLVRTLATSRDPFEKRFRRIVGASPKQFASLIRARHALATHRPGLSLAALAAESGYFDESHLSRELRALTGLSPARFFRSSPDLPHPTELDVGGASDSGFAPPQSGRPGTARVTALRTERLVT